MVREDVKRRGGGEGSGLQVEERERERASSGKRWPTPQFWVLPAVDLLAYRSAKLFTIAELNKTLFNQKYLASPPISLMLQPGEGVLGREGGEAVGGPYDQVTA